MTSKYFVPKKEDLEFETILGEFPCQTEDCELEQSEAKWFKRADRIIWTCEFGHGNVVKASDYV